MALAICTGIALAAACGFRVFLPLLATSLAVHYGYFSPSPSMTWIGSTPAVAILVAATIAEVAAYYIPWVDNLLDTIASPAAVVAGTVAAAAAFGNIDPAFKWAMALIAGGGAAALVQSSTVLTRAVSTATTGGAANPIVATAEGLGAALVSFLAILLPLLALGTLVVMLLIVFIWARRRKSRRSEIIGPQLQV